MSTSGEFRTGPITSVTIDREGRQRKELKNVPELAASISRRGLIHPILVTRSMELVAGERRLEACRSLGWTQIAYQFTDEVSPDELRALELEENVGREELPWQDRVAAVREFHELRVAEDPEWTQVDTGAALGFHRSTIGELLAVAGELASGNERVLAAPMLSTARGIVRRTAERAQDSTALAALLSPVVKSAAPVSILNADFHEWVKTYAGPKFNLIHCDFPYGIGADSFNQGGAATHGGYSDTPETYWGLVHGLNGALERIAAESCHLLFWFSMDYYTPTVAALGEAGWKVTTKPLIWHRSDNSGILPDPQRGPRQIYETALLASRGDRKIISAVSNLVAHPSEKDVHMSIKPKGMLQHFFRMLIDGSSRVLDPTTGSGSSIRAAMAQGAQSALGLEKDPTFAQLAQTALEKDLTNAKNIEALAE